MTGALLGQSGNGDGRSRRATFAHSRRIGGVHGVEFGDVGEKYVDMQDVIEIGIDRSEHDFEGIYDLSGFGRDAALDQDAGCWIDAGSAADGDEIADL